MKGIMHYLELTNVNNYNEYNLVSYIIKYGST